ncbi:hypothetical protein P2318_01205 [Myxococcaceae bacterium GXIMD 01537]
MATLPDDLRARLEDRADLLEAARLRYRAVVGMLTSLFWRDKVRAHLELLREVARAQPEVDATLASVERRAAAEGWPAEASPMRLLAEVRELRGALEAAVARRLSARGAGTLGEALLRLEEEVLDAGPLLGGRTWARAVELLPRNLQELRAACAAAEVFERVFKRPAPPEGALPFSAAEAGELRRALPLAEAALESLDARLERFDPGGKVLAYLQRRARRAPTRPPGSGPELLMHAAFWHGVARSRLGALMEARLAPVVPAPREVPELLEWLVSWETSVEARLEVGTAFGEGRAGLFEVAAMLAALSRARPSEVWGEETAWVRLWTAAQRARGEEGEDVERVREALRLFIRLRGASRTPARLFSPERLPAPGAGEDASDLPGLVQLARNAARPRSSTG